MRKKFLISKKRFSKGLTLVELLISITVLLVVMALVTNMIINTTKTQARLRMENQMRQTVNSGLYRISNHLSQTRMVMQADTLGYAYLGRVTLTGAPPMIGGVPTANATTNRSQLPTIRPDGSLSPEKNCTNFPNNFYRSNIVGNVLMFAKYAGKFSRFSIAAATERRNLDIYQFKVFYVTDDSNLPAKEFLDHWKNPPTKRRLRLIEWTSRPYVDYQQFVDYIADSSAANRTTIRTELTAAGITTAWDRPATAIGNAFYNVGAGGAVAVPANAGHTIQRLRHNDVLLFGSDAMSVSYNSNDDTASANYFPIRNQVPYFYAHNPPDCDGALPAPNTTPDSSTSPFPYGFEVMIVGPASGRNVLLRVTSAGRTYNNLISHANMLTTYARDL